MLRFFSRSFSVPCAPFSILGGPGETCCDGVRYPVHIGWNGSDVSMAGLVIVSKSPKITLNLYWDAELAIVLILMKDRGLMVIF